MHIFRLDYLIHYDGQVVGRGANTTRSTDKENDGREALKATVKKELRKKYPDKNFEVTISRSQKNLKEEDIEGWSNGWMIETALQ